MSFKLEFQEFGKEYCKILLSIGDPPLKHDLMEITEPCAAL